MRRLFLLFGIALIVPLLTLRRAPAAPDKDDKKEEKKEDKKPAAGKSVIAVFRLKGTLREASADDLFLFGSPLEISLKDLVARLKKAAEDPAVKAVVLLPESPSIGSAQVEEVRQAMRKLKAAGKDVYVHADSLTMREYVLLSGASRLSMAPTADLWLTGLYGEAVFLRGLLDKLGVKPDFLTCGAYKSATEIFMRDSPSPEAEKMQNWIMDGLFDTYVQLIARGRHVSPERAREWIDEGPYTAEKARAAGLIDAVEHREEFTAGLKAKYGKDVVFNKKFGEKKPPTLDLTSPLGVFKMWADLLGEATKKKTGKDAVGIVYVEGPIVLGDSETSLFGGAAARSSEIRKALDEAARDATVKAVVLRVNSPGGSAVASEIILHATEGVKAKKPFIVSMGDVAASGGYYVASGSDLIYADDSTITGSIGVLGGKLVTNGMWNKIGVTFKPYQRGKNAAILSSAQVWSPSERERMQAWMDDIYKVFKGHVTASRGNRLTKPIDDLAGGRVYTGRQARELGLVDKIATLEDAVHHVAAQAKLTEYDVRVIPEPKNFLERLIEETSGGKNDPHQLDTATRPLAVGPQASLVDLATPYLRHLDPQRVGVIKTALQRLELLQREGVILMTPEMPLPR